MILLDIFAKKKIDLTCARNHEEPADAKYKIMRSPESSAEMVTSV